MKSKKYPRQIPTKNGTRPGVQSITVSVPETDEEWEEAATRADDVRLRLHRLIESAEERLEGLPGNREAYQLTPDGGWVSVEADLAEGKKVLYWQRGYSTGAELLGTGPTLPIERASPQEFAWLAREDAEAALQAMDDGDMNRAMIHAMSAESNWGLMYCGENYERAVVIKRDSDELLEKNKGRKHHPAVAALRDWLSRKYPGQEFREWWEHIPEGDTCIELAGFRVSRGEYVDPQSGEIIHENCLLIENMSEKTLEHRAKDSVYRACRTIPKK